MILAIPQANQGNDDADKKRDDVGGNFHG
jgi:hypothetical protein